MASTWTSVSAGGADLTDLVQWMCIGPARLLGLQGLKGALGPGCDADFVVFDPEATYEPPLGVAPLTWAVRRSDYYVLLCMCCLSYWFKCYLVSVLLLWPCFVGRHNVSPPPSPTPPSPRHAQHTALCVVPPPPCCMHTLVLAPPPPATTSMGATGWLVDVTRCLRTTCSPKRPR